MSALSDRGLAQGKMGAAVDTWHQHFLLDPGLLTFHKGVVDLLQETPAEYKWTGNFACAVFPVGIDSTELQMGNRSKALGIMSGFYWKERVSRREQAKAGIEDLEQIWDAAVWLNEKLVWGPAGQTPAAPTWPPPPSGSAATASQNLAVQIISQSPTDYGRFADADGRPCDERLAEFITIYEISFENE